jgi:hypothetical protein
MASNYVRGRAMEYKVMYMLEACGFRTTRSASSHGLADVVAVRADEVRYVQVKLTKSGDFSEDENCRELRDLPVPGNVRKELWIFHGGKGLVEIRDLKRPKFDARTEEGRTEREAARKAAATMKEAYRRRKAAA